jgi:hypothetical protein
MSAVRWLAPRYHYSLHVQLVPALGNQDAPLIAQCSCCCVSVSVYGRRGTLCSSLACCKACMLHVWHVLHAIRCTLAVLQCCEGACAHGAIGVLQPACHHVAPAGFLTLHSHRVFAWALLAAGNLQSEQQAASSTH